MPAPLATDASALVALVRTAAEIIDAIAELEQQKSRTSAAQARLAARLDDLVRAEHRDLRLPAAEQGRGSPPRSRSRDVSPRPADVGSSASPTR